MSQQPIPITDLFDTERIPSLCNCLLLICYLPAGFACLIVRLFVGCQTFVVASLLRKATFLRTVILRVMCAVLGVVVRQKGRRAPKAKMMCANHVSALDHLAVDLVQSCILPSVWDIASVLKWVFGYVNLGKGRDEIVYNARLHIENQQLPILAFPEGAITNGRIALLKFSTWPMEASNQIQPVAISLWRPIEVRSALLGSSWYTDVCWFLYLPFTVITVEWLPVLTKNEEEPLEDFAARIAKSVANALSISTSNITNMDAVEAAKRYANRNGPTPKKTVKRTLPPARLDELAMKIKQSHPAVPVFAIRQDLGKTMDPKETVERIMAGKLAVETPNTPGKMTTNPVDWKRLYESRKWEMIEANRSRYLQKATADME